MISLAYPSIAIALLSLAAQVSHAQQAPPVTAPPAASTAAAPSTRSEIDTTAFRAAIREANDAMTREDFSAAEASYARAVAADPSSAAAHYNHGVAQYRCGHLKAAADSFAAASHSPDASLAAHAMFNQGNAVYADALAQLESNPEQSGVDAAAGTPAIKAALEATRSAFTHFKDAARADRTDLDARVNAETAARLLKQLEEMQKKQEQKKQEQKNDQKNEEKSDKQEQPQDQPQKSDEKQQSEESGEPKDQKPESQQPTPQPDTKGTPPEPPEDPKPSGGVVKDAPLTKEEAERLLQAVRDREKARTDATEKVQRTKQAPASRDW